jgi:hypothetical protein
MLTRSVNPSGTTVSVMSLIVATTPDKLPLSSKTCEVRITTSRSIPLPVFSRTVQFDAEGP